MNKNLDYPLRQKLSEEDEADEIIRRLATTPPKYNQGDFTYEMWIYPIKHVIKGRDGKWKTIGKKKQTKSSGD